MKKIQKYLTAICLCITVSIASAQYITIPDSNFANYLDSIVPTAMNGNQMDTTNPVLQKITRIYIENMGIDSLYGIQYFDSLQTLDCGNGSPSVDSNKITWLFNLPATLDTLICGNNRIGNLPKLPGSIVLLKCYLNRLTNLLPLPINLIYFDCSNNSLGTLIKLPSKLTSLYCENNQLTNLPLLPAGLINLDCSVNQLTNLPVLPSSLVILNVAVNPFTVKLIFPPALTNLSCDDDLQTSLSALPATLSYLSCSDNQLGNLPSLPLSLTYLNCSGDSLSSLPVLPTGLQYLLCGSNQLTGLPLLPASLGMLECSNNNISCFPVFPATLTDTLQFDITNNPFQCLPNYVQGMPAGTLAFPLCLPGNPNGCPPATGIVGFTYDDKNIDCIKDSGDRNLLNIPVQLYNASDSLIALTYTAVNGVYDFPVLPGSYTVNIDTVGMPYVIQCSHPGVDSTVMLSTVDTNINFSIGCKPGFDVGVRSVITKDLVFPGMTHTLSVVAGDMSQWYNLGCASGMSGKVQITINGPVTYAGTGPGALTPVITGNLYTYAIPDFGLIDNNTAFNLLLNTSTTANAGDTICVRVYVTPSPDNNTSNNYYQFCYNVVNSHDPNIKETYPVDVPPLYNDWFVYTIHFQNTGSAPAHNILLMDTLDNNLDLSTFQVINYSNKNTVMLSGNLLSVQFPSINLPDSLSNPSGSTGFVQYRVKPKNGLLNGIVIKNTGYIYFDYNAPVITNTSHNFFIAPAGINEINNIACKVYPNPSKGKFVIETPDLSALLKDSKPQLYIFNELGQSISYQSSYTGSSFMVDMGIQPSGVYFYRIISNTGNLLAEGKLSIE